MNTIHTNQEKKYLWDLDGFDYLTRYCYVNEKNKYIYGTIISFSPENNPYHPSSPYYKHAFCVGEAVQFIQKMPTIIDRWLTD